MRRLDISRPQAVEGQKSTCPDDDVFSEISAIYANNHPFMWTGWVAPRVKHSAR